MQRSVCKRYHKEMWENVQAGQEKSVLKAADRWVKEK